GRRRKFPGIAGLFVIVRTKARKQVENVVGGEGDRFACQTDRQSELVKTQTFRSSYASQLFCSLAVKWRFRINQNAHQARLIFFVERVETKLDAVGNKFFTLRFDGVGDAA